MKTILSLLLILCLLCGCEKKADPIPETTPPVTAPTEAVLSELDAFGDVLAGDRDFIETLSGERWDISRLGETITIEDIPCSVHRIAVADLDGDGIREAVLQLKLGQDEYAGFEVLRYQNEEVYGYPFSYRSFLEPKVDGTFRLSGGAFYSGIGKVTFDTGSAVVTPIAERMEELTEDGTSTVRYSIDGASAAEEEFRLLEEVQNTKPDVIWYETWDAVLSSDPSTT